MDLDLSAFKSLVIHDSAAEERVQVNQRHLIDKILARYSAPFTIYRELLQNANDAGATEAKIHFRTKTPDDAHNPTSFDPNASCHTVLFQNNGRPFQPEDWNRLKKIAEGNPDEQKIGFFGVGFYSLFSICEEPFVVSDQECMAFFWKGDQLYTKRLAVPEPMRQLGGWTTFSLDLREPVTVPEVEEFGRFLACSIAFTQNLRSVSLYLDDQLLVKVSKKVSEPNPLSCTHPTGQRLTNEACQSLHTRSPHGVFQLSAVYGLQVQIDAEYLKCTKTSGMFWSSGPKFSRISSTLFLKIAQAHLTTHVTPAFADQMERTTKKSPPKTTLVQMIYTGLEEYEASISVHQDFPIFRDLLPYPHQGKVFIGFPTHQTTGCSVHLAAHLIPTVERESIDFVDPHLARWNQEMLSMCALLARVLYDEEIADISQRYLRLVDGPKPKEGSPSGEPDPAMTWLERRCIHAMTSFCFHPATPIKTVGKLMEKCFFASGKVPPGLLSSCGVKPCDQVRLPDPELVPFLRTTPYLPSKIQKEAGEMLSSLQERYHLVKVGLPDLIRDVSGYAITVDQAVALLRWWLGFKESQGRGHLPPEHGQQLLRAITLLNPLPSFSLGSPEIGAKDAVGPTMPVALAEFRYFLNPKVVHQGLPVPQETLPFELTRHFNQRELREAFGTWKELTLAIWTEHVVQQHRSELTTSPVFSEKIHHVLYRGFYQQSPNDRALMLSLLEGVACIPTQLGQRLPKETYFKNVKLFSDLPIVQLAKFPSGMERFLGDLGVRTHVDLQLVFDRLEHLNWDFMKLLKYLASVKSQLSEAEMEKLSQTPLFPARSLIGQSPTKAPSAKSQEPSPPPARFKASELYAPVEPLSNLGLPVIAWPDKWRDSSEEAKFLQRLGLRTNPPLDRLMLIAATAESPETRMNALRFFIEHFASHYQRVYRREEIQIPLIPCTRLSPRPGTGDSMAKGATLGDQFTKTEAMAKPTECYANPASEVMGFKIVHPELRRDAEKFGILEQPPVATLITFLQASPPGHPTYGRWVFEYLASRQADFTSADWEKLRFLKFIPVQSSNETPVYWMAPGECYFINDTVDFKYDFFTYIHFGPIANLFLKACGVQEEPSPVDLARIITKDPPKFLEASSRDHGYEHYLQVLRQLAIQMPTLSRHSDIMRAMRSRPFLIAVREKGGQSMAEKKSDQHPMDVSEASVLEYRLESPGNICLVDDTVLQKTFNPWYAPMETLLETFYEQLGSTWISKQVTESSRPTGAITQSGRSQALQNLIRERAPLLIYDYQREQSTKVLRSSEWLATKLRVLEVDQIHIHRKFLPTHQVHTEATTACLERGLRGVDAPRDAVFLLISRQDYNEFDIATCLCKILFSKSRLNDALLLETLLSTSLQHLKRKGFPVDRILNHQKAVTPAATPKPVEPAPPRSSTPPKGSPASDQPPPYEPKGPTQPAPLPAHLNPYFSQLQAMFPDCDPNYLKSCLLEEKRDHVARVSNRLLDDTYPRLPNHTTQKERTAVGGKQPAPQPPATTPPTPVPTSSNLMDRLSRRFQSGINDWYKSYDKPSGPSTTTIDDSESKHQPIPGGFPSLPRPPKSQSQSSSSSPNPSQPGGEPVNTVGPDHTELLQRSLKSSVDSCVRNVNAFDGREPEKAATPPPPKDYTGEAHHHYCSVIPPQKLAHCARIGQFDLYLETGMASSELFACDLAGQSVPLVQFDRLTGSLTAPDGSTMAPGSNLHSLHLMGHTLTTLVQVFQLNPASVHLYYDREGPTVAFNRGRSLFFNLRYFLLLHHPRMAVSPTEAADVHFYWFMVACHELAHNFVSDHNAQHEFYLSSFAEQYLGPLVRSLLRMGKVSA
ncbi:hypothetical protein K493DRAFT_272766 [Basidiobolus meristosporus CBS 931.73]|uniref:CUE domain-containing protein n=1 Tax=Basidiobolus meristosporus CBS 931.73 TaxID=1314790 RepID=A0A1Y1ZDW6_9FUNG|nr:hypothetical protein K493DRAFT_272766 [Basidiobolus meristosporus CBS 931.73]|eukprot:ORY08409.1 hypothetical protein K493DRAFT_272766 [Basidiobolus meristosporus CBS 931.73]